MSLRSVQFVRTVKLTTSPSEKRMVLAKSGYVCWVMLWAFLVAVLISWFLTVSF